MTEATAVYGGQASPMPPTPGSPVLSASASPASTVSGGLDNRTFRVDIINPTTVLHKAQVIVDRAADVYFLAETAAVRTTQHIVTQQLRRLQVNAVWSPPSCSPSKRG